MKSGFGCCPVVVGGVGGSGTRVVVSILQALGIFMGSDLNESLDNMQLARIFHRLRDRIHTLGPIGTTPDPAAKAEAMHFIRQELGEFIENMHTAYYAQNVRRAGWGWKVPGNHFILPYLAEILPRMRYVHVIRHGADMAFSANQNQLRMWGSHFGIQMDARAQEQASLAFWIAANRRAVSEAERLGIEFTILNFNHLCQHPQEVICGLLGFLSMPADDLASLAQLVCPPASLNRHMGRNLDFCGPDERAALKELGFDG